MRKYVDVLGSMNPSTHGVRQVADIVAAMAPPSPGSTALVPTGPQSSTKSKALAILPGAGGAVVGAYWWKKHRVLGALVGHALGSNAKPLYDGDRKHALCQMGAEGAAVAGSLYWKKHPILGWIAGGLAGSVALSFVAGCQSVPGALWAEYKKRAVK
jgi:hypothetical protein